MSMSLCTLKERYVVSLVRNESFCPRCRSPTVGLGWHNCAIIITLLMENLRGTLNNIYRVTVTWGSISIVWLQFFFIVSQFLKELIDTRETEMPWNSFAIRIFDCNWHNYPGYMILAQIFTTIYCDIQSFENVGDAILTHELQNWSSPLFKTSACLCVTNLNESTDN